MSVQLQKVEQRNTALVTDDTKHHHIKSGRQSHTTWNKKNIYKNWTNIQNEIKEQGGLCLNSLFMLDYCVIY